MWTRAQLKTNAKSQLSQYYWYALLCSFVGGLLGGVGIGGSSQSSFSINLNPVSGLGSQATFGDAIDDPDAAAAILGISIAIFVIIMIISLCVIAFNVLVSNVISVGISRFYLTAPQGERNIGVLFYGFQDGRWKDIAKNMFLTQLSIFLWSLLLIIPGIIKSYEYRFVPCIISENPHMSAQEAKEISSVLTYGHKLDMWVLDLSFFGWNILASLVPFVGSIFLKPYVEATWTELFMTLRQNPFYTSKNSAV